MPPPPATTPAWADLHARIDEAHDAWETVTQGLSGEEAAPAGSPSGADEESWSSAQVHSHIATALLCYADALSYVALGQPATLDEGQRLLTGHHPYSRICHIGDKAWTDFRNAARTVAKQPERGDVVRLADGTLSARILVQRALDHVQEHIEQIRFLRATER